MTSGRCRIKRDKYVAVRECSVLRDGTPDEVRKNTIRSSEAVKV